MASLTVLFIIEYILFIFDIKFQILCIYLKKFARHVSIAPQNTLTCFFFTSRFPDPFDTSVNTDGTQMYMVSEVSMQGDLYRRKLGHWVNSWAVLTADSVFTLYKSKEVFEEMKHLSHGFVLGENTMLSSSADTQEYKPGIVLSINLKDGCEIENITQGLKKLL